MKKNYRNILLCMLAITVMAGCQATPDEAAVQGKDGELIGRIMGGSAQSSYEAPAHWEQTVDIPDRDIEIEFNADIIVPAVEKIPVYQVGELGFTQQQVDAMAKYFTDRGCKLLPSDSSKRTKSMISDQIMHLKMAQRAVNEAVQRGDKAAGYHGGTDPSTGEEKLTPLYSVDVNGTNVLTNAELLSESIKDLEQKYAQAPDTIDSEVSTHLVDMESEYVSATTTDVSIGSATGIGRFNITNMQMQGQLFYSSDENDDTHYFRPSGRYSDSQPENVSMSKEQATQIAEEFIEAAGLSDMQLYMVKSCIYPDANRHYWMAQYRHVIDGIPVGYDTQSHISQSELAETETSLAPQWNHETLNIVINDTGITNINWMGRANPGEKLNENVELLPFEQVQDIIKKQLPMKLGEAYLFVFADTVETDRKSVV